MKHPQIVPLSSKQNIIPQIIIKNPTQQKTLVTINSEEIDNMPRDVFETFPPSRTFIPQLFTTPSNKQNVEETLTKIQPQFIIPNIISGESNKDNKELVSISSTIKPKMEIKKPIVNFDEDATSNLISSINASQTIRPELNEPSKKISTTTQVSIHIIFKKFLSKY